MLSRKLAGRCPGSVAAARACSSSMRALARLSASSCSRAVCTKAYTAWGARCRPSAIRRSAAASRGAASSLAKRSKSSSTNWASCGVMASLPRDVGARPRLMWGENATPGGAREIFGQPRLGGCATCFKRRGAHGRPQRLLADARRIKAEAFGEGRLDGADQALRGELEFHDAVDSLRQALLDGAAAEAGFSRRRSQRRPAAFRPLQVEDVLAAGVLLYAPGHLQLALAAR